MSERKPLTKLQFARIALDQNGRCGCGCGKRLDFQKPRQITDEHLNPLFSGGANDLENRALWDSDCSKEKTRKEAPDRAKVRRIEQGKTQADKRSRRGGSSIHGRGFQPKPEGYVSPLSKEGRRR